MVRLVLALLLVLPTLGQTEKYPELGMTFTPPGGYAQLPVRPGERHSVLAYVDRSGAVSRPAALDVHLVPRGDLGLDVKGFLGEHLGASSIQELPAGRKRYGHGAQRFSFEVEEEGVSLSGWAHAWLGPERVYLILGSCELDEVRRQRLLWARCAENLRLFEASSGRGERARWQRYYGAHRELVGIGERIQARLDLVDGWRMNDSQHYVLLSHQVDGATVTRLAEEVETLRHEFARLCGIKDELDQVAVVRICQDEEEFLAYGGRSGAAGYWSPAEEELVLFDASGDSGSGLDGGHYTRAVLFHEAFHQYVYYAAGGISPHPWFDEGMAEFYAGALVEGRRFTGVEPNRYRLASARALLKGGAYPWQAVIAMDQGAFYSDPGRLYAQAWSMVHFLATLPEVGHNRTWSAVLPTYLESLRASWLVERRRLAPGDSPAAARQRARTQACSAAFRGVEWAELEAAWRRHLAGLELPRAR